MKIKVFVWLWSLSSNHQGVAKIFLEGEEFMASGQASASWSVLSVFHTIAMAPCHYSEVYFRLRGELFLWAYIVHLLNAATHTNHT